MYYFMLINPIENNKILVLFQLNLHHSSNKKQVSEKRINEEHIVLSRKLIGHNISYWENIKGLRVGTGSIILQFIINYHHRRETKSMENVA